MTLCTLHKVAALKQVSTVLIPVFFLAIRIALAIDSRMTGRQLILHDMQAFHMQKTNILCVEMRGGLMYVTKQTLLC